MNNENFKLNIFKSFGILFIFNILIFSIFYCKTGNYLTDFSREVYVPFAMNSGEVLYKDIFNVYAPLGYQINAVITSIFGLNLNTFYFIGFFNTLLFSFGLFLIFRLFMKNKLKNAILLTLFPLVCCSYSVSLTNYITPYSYSILYALNSFLYALVSVLYFVKKREPKFFVLASFLYGISIACKYEFVLFGFILLALMIKERLNKKYLIYSFLAFISVPTLSIIDLIVKGVNCTIIQNSVNNILLLSKANSVKVLYKFLGFIPTITSLKELLFNFLNVGIAFSLLFFTLSLVKNKIVKITLAILFVALLSKYLIQSNAFYFNWIGISGIIVFVSIIKDFYKKGLSLIDKLFLVLTSTTLLCSFKSIFSISFNSYGTYYFPLLFAVLSLYLIVYKFNDECKVKTYLIIVGILASSYLVSNCYRALNAYDGIYNTDKGTIIAEKTLIDSTSKLVDYIKNNTQKEETVLVMPEGAIINFLADRRSNNKYYYLIPPNIDVFGEANISNDLKKNLPDYIVLQPMSYTNFEETFFCESFGLEICKLIPQYYESPIVFGNDFWFAIYKKKI